MKKTAVEIAIFRIKQLQIGLSSSSQKIALEQVMDILEQAKAMEKEQVEDAYYQGALDEHNCIYSTKSFEQYYNETFKL